MSPLPRRSYSVSTEKRITIPANTQIHADFGTLIDNTREGLARALSGATCNVQLPALFTGHQLPP